MRTWLTSWRQLFRRQPASRRPAARPTFEALEDRSLPAITAHIVPVTLSEGIAYNGPVATFTDTNQRPSDTYMATIDYGNGTRVPGVVVGRQDDFLVIGLLTFQDPAVVELGVTIKDADGAEVTVTDEVTVADGRLTLTGLALNAVERQEFSGAVAAFTDSDPAAPPGQYAATINWGDGVTGDGTVTKADDGTFSVSGKHTYAREGAYNVAVQIRDTTGPAQASAVSLMNVAPAVPLHVRGLQLKSTEAEEFAGAVATFTDDDAAAEGATPKTYTVSINWGDGQTDAGTVEPDGEGGFRVLGKHTYARLGNYEILVTVLDDQGNTDNALATAEVADGALVGFATTVEARRGNAVNNALVAKFQDLGGAEPAESYTVAINWGDGNEAQGAATFTDGTFEVNASHRYARPGKYVVTTTIHSAGGSSVVVESNATIGSQFERWVERAYQDLLGRSADPAGLEHWVGLLEQGVARGTVVQAILRSPEYLTKLVREHYQQFLGRDADPAGLASFVSYLASGGTPTGLKVFLMGSAEYFQNRGGGTREGFVSALYRDLFARDPEPAALALYTQILRAGLSNAHLALFLATSREHAIRVVQGYYQRFLHRAGDVGGLNGFANLLQNGVREDQVIAAFVASDEYFNNA